MNITKDVVHTITLDRDEQFELDLAGGRAMVGTLVIDQGHEAEPRLVVRGYGMKKNGEVGRGPRSDWVTPERLPEHLREIVVRLCPALQP